MRRNALFLVMLLFMAGCAGAVRESPLSLNRAESVSMTLSATSAASPWFTQSPKNRSLAEFAGMIRERKGLRISPEEYGRVLGWRVPLPADPEGIADFFDSAKRGDDRLELVPCTPELLARLELAGLDEDGNPVWGSRRKTCYDGEMFVFFVNENGSREPLVSLACGNPLREKARAEPPVPKSLPVFTLKMNVWKDAAAEVPCAKKLIAETEIGYSFRGPDRVSRTCGATFREMYAEGELLRSRRTHMITVSFIKEDARERIVEERIVGAYAVRGVREFLFSESSLEGWDAIRIVFAEDSALLSPLRSSWSGEREIRINRGEWENSQDTRGDQDRVENAHAIEGDERAAPVPIS